MTTGEKITGHRMKLGLSQVELAEQLGCTRSALGYWERDKRPPGIQSCKAMEDLFGLSENSLVPVKSAVCDHCGQEFRPKAYRSGKRFCSDNCRNRARAPRPRETLTGGPFAEMADEPAESETRILTDATGLTPGSNGYQRKGGTCTASSGCRKGRG